MSRLENLRPNAAVYGILPNAPVIFVSEDVDRFEDCFRNGIHGADAGLAMEEGARTAIA
jgi:hypothetical protein